MISPDNPNLIIEGPFFRVATELSSAPLRDHLWHGYDDRWEFEKALRRLLNYWGGRCGELVKEKHGGHSLLLRFHDTPGGLPDEAWLPRYLLTPCPRPEYMPPILTPEEQTAKEIEDEIDEAFGFD